MREEGGFGIITVMMGAVVLGIFALVYTQQMQNRANISLIGDLMSFREQVITYYGSVLANRSSWECTVRDNSALELYLAGGTAYSGSGPLNVRDYTGDCQEGFVGAGTAQLLIPTTGLQLKLMNYSDLPVYPPAPPLPCDNTSTEHFCLKAEWEGLDSSLGSNMRGVEVTLTLIANRKNIKNDLDVSFELADKEYALYMNRTVATDCSDGRVTGYFPGTTTGTVPSSTTAPHMTGTGVNAYAGDTAVVDFDAVTGLVACSGRGPLIIPPCYNISDISVIGVIKTNPFLSGTGMPGYRGFQSDHGFKDIVGNNSLRCDGAGSAYSGYGGVSLQPKAVFKGKCPETGGEGTTAIAYFDEHTGISHCSHPNILVEKTSGANATQVCDGTDQYGVVKIRQSDEAGGVVGTFQCSTDYWSSNPNKGGVEPVKCGAGKAIGGFNNDGSISHCVQPMPGRPGPPGFPGIQGPPASC